MTVSQAGFEKLSYPGVTELSETARGKKTKVIPLLRESAVRNLSLSIVNLPSEESLQQVAANLVQRGGQVYPTNASDIMRIFFVWMHIALRL